MKPAESVRTEKLLFRNVEVGVDNQVSLDDLGDFGFLDSS